MFKNFFIAGLFLLATFSLPAIASSPVKIGDYLIHYNVMATAELNPQVAQGYGITRSKGFGFVRVTVNKQGENGKLLPVDARVSGQVSNLAGQLQSLGFKSHAVGQDLGHFNLATFRYTPEDPLRFNLKVTYEGGKPAAELNFIERIYFR